MRILTFCLSLFCILTFVVTNSCINNHKSTSVLDKISSREMAVANVIGAYAGNLPCVDCDAIATVLHLDRDHSYKLTYKFEGKSKDQFVKEGSWSIDKNCLELNGLDYKYKIEPEYLVQLDLSGQEITGDLADQYQLIKVK